MPRSVNARERERVARTEVMEWQVERFTRMLEERGVEDAGRAIVTRNKVKISKLNENN